ncbi:hypothetical protein BV898_01944 [Hypsibius exemplaris]|uniref:Prominin-like protein n=1 Tax=Hypsibius exemplaris TaxID=2072580 RepID=A0A1W0XAR6_HYPEX|nr:hypothetical protein BV898_01944 [Hypsibius exemplaris]
MGAFYSGRISLLALTGAIVVVMMGSGICDATAADAGGRGGSNGTESAASPAAAVLSPGIPVDYTPYVSDTVYSNNATVRKFDAKGMLPLYVVTDLFMNLVGSDLKKDIPADLIPAEDGNIGDVYAYSKQWMAFERGVVICAGVGVGLAILVPLVGLLFCCCRCCGKCGANAKKTDRNSDPCQCGTLTVAFVLLCLILTFGVVCAFVTNEYMRTNVRKVNSTYADTTQDLQAYLRDSKSHASHILVRNFDELKDHIKESLNDTEVTSERLFDSGVDFVGADHLFAFGDRLARADKGITSLDASFTRLRSLEQTLRSNVTTIRGWLDQILQECSTERGQPFSGLCTEISHARQNLALAIDFSDLALSSALGELERRISPSVVTQVREARLKLSSVRADLNKELRNASGLVMGKLEEARTQMRGIELKIREQANDARLQLSKLDLSPYFDYVYQYNNYVWYGKLSLCVLILLILVIFILATLFGVCGSRIGSLYEDPFCNKGKGACLMMCGVGLVFVFYFFVAIAVTALFVVGINLQLLGCDSVSNPTASNHLKVLGIVLHQYGVIESDLKDVPQILQKCHNNEGIYNVFALDSTYHVRGVMEKRLADMDVLPAVGHIVNDATRRIKSTKFLSELDRAALLDLANAPWINNISLESMKQQLAPSEVLKGNLEAIINGTFTVEPMLKALAADKVGITFVIRRELTRLEQDLIPLIDAEKKNALTIVNDLSVLLVERNPSDDIRSFVNETDIAEARFHQNSEPIIRTIANDTLDNVERYVSQYMNYSLYEMMNSVGRCGPASAAINSTIDAICLEVMRPFNGYWLSIGWFLIILLPGLLIGIALAWHYRLPESFRSGSSDSSDYETQMEIDTIPLAHRQARKRVHPTATTLDNSAYDSRARQSKATQWAFHNAFKHQTPNGYYPVRKASGGPSAPMGDESIYTRPPSYYYPGSNS